MANESQCWLSGLIASDGTSTAGVNPKVNHVDINAVCKLVSTLCLYIDPLAPAPPKSAGGVRTVRGAVQFLAPLQTLLANWPEGFANHVGERIAAGGSGARTLNTLLGQWYVRLRSSCHGNPLEAFLRVVIDVAARDFDGALGLDSAQHLASDASGYVRVAEAAKTLGLSGDRLIKAVQAGECQFRTRRFGTRGKVYEIPKSEVDRISHFREAWVGEARACEMAGVSAAVLVNMVASSVIGADAQWRRDLLKGGPIEAVSIDELHQRINALAAPHKHDDNSVVSWTELTSRRMGDKRGIQAVMKAAASGEIVAIRRGRQLGKVAFLRSDVSRYFGTPILEAGMSLQQLSEVTGWKWESIDHWLSLGLLVSQSIMLRGQPCRVVSPAELLRFRQNYLPLADLARAMGTKSSSLADQLIDVPIVGAKTLPNGTRRGGLLRVAALGELAVLGSRVVRDRVEMSCPQER